VLVVGGGLTIAGARILLLYPPLMVVLGCFYVILLFHMSSRLNLYDFVCFKWTGAAVDSV
jgi:hypothetical protein